MYKSKTFIRVIEEAIHQHITRKIDFIRTNKHVQQLSMFFIFLEELNRRRTAVTYVVCTKIYSIVGNPSGIIIVNNRQNKMKTNYNNDIARACTRIRYFIRAVIKKRRRIEENRLYWK